MKRPLLVFALLGLPVLADETPPVPKPAPSIFELIDKAKEFLKDEHPAPIFKSAKGKKIVIGKETLRATLMSDGTLRLVRIGLVFVKKGKKDEAAVQSVEPDNCTAERIGGGGVNANYRIVCDGQEELVLRGKNLLLDFKGHETKTLDGRSEADYTPYSDELAKPEVIEKGDIYFRNQISEAAEWLRRDRIYSHAIPGKLVADVFAEKIIFGLGSSEHIDHDEYEAYGPEYSENKVLTQFGLNGPDTFQYSISYIKNKPGALCLMQVMALTYNDRKTKKGIAYGIRSLYPEAKLPFSAHEGACGSHASAIRVAYLVLDSKLSAMPFEFKKLFLEDPETYGIYLAVAYNGGEGKAIALFKKTARNPKFNLLEFLGDLFDKFHVKKGKMSKEEKLRIANEKKDLRVLRKETWIYIKKYFEIMKEVKTIEIAPAH